MADGFPTPGPLGIVRDTDPFRVKKALEGFKGVPWGSANAAKDSTRGEGLRVRLARIPGETPKGVLARALILPAVIGDFGWTEEFEHSEYTTVSAGDFSQPAVGPVSARKLRSLDDISTLTMTWDPPWLVQQGLDPDYVYRDLFAIGRSRQPVELLAALQLAGKRPLLRLDVTLRSITTQMRQGEPDTTYYTLRLREWRSSDSRRRGAGQDSKLPTTVKLDADDTLSSLSEKWYRTPQNADELAKANGITKFGKNTALVKHAKFKVGSKFKIPLLSSRATLKGGQGHLPARKD